MSGEGQDQTAVGTYNVVSTWVFRTGLCEIVLHQVIGGESEKDMKKTYRFHESAGISDIRLDKVAVLTDRTQRGQKGSR
jgi:hypothetical protein